MRRAPIKAGEKVSIKISRENYNLLRSFGDSTGKSVSCLVHSAIEDFLERAVDSIKIEQALSKLGCETRKELVAKFLADVNAANNKKKL